jgi:competence protein ComEA
VKDWLSEHKFSVLIAAILICGGFYYFFVNNFEEAPNQAISAGDNINLSEEPEGENKNVANNAGEPEKIMVDVKGQIKQPGVYLSTAGERVIDVISRAGGLTDQADQSQVNFAEHLQDEMVIYIPALGEESLNAPGPSGGSLSPSGGQGTNQSRININKADEMELQNLPGIGPAKATAIIEYRNSSGPFKSIEDLKNISGIGDKTFEKLKELINVH